MGESKKSNSYSKNDLLEAMRELNDLEEVKLLQLVADDITPEALAILLKANDERLSIISAEGGIFGLLAGRYNENTNLDLYLKSYSAEYFQVARVSRELIELKKPVMTVSLAVQPQIITDIMSNTEFRGRGLLARFLYSMPNSKVGDRVYDSEPVGDAVRKRYDDQIKSLLQMDIPENPKTIELSQDAQEMSRQYYEMIEKRLNEDLEPVEDWSGKLVGNTMRIAALFHILKNKEDAAEALLDADTMEAAVQCGMYYLEHSKAAFEIMGMPESQDEKDAKSILAHCVTLDKRDKRDKPLSYTKREILRMCRNFHKADDLDAGLECLVDRGYICIMKEKPEKGGRISERVYFNPEYLEQLK